MKLSKEELIELMYAVGTEFGSYDDKIKAEAIIKALKDNDLEIEGYERSEWTRFDPDDSRTFPTKTGGSIVLIHFKYAGLNIVECAKFNFSWWTSAHVTHWRPLPKPPGKEEAR